VIDLHTHILPGLDDGPADLEGSIAIAREAALGGVTALAATPHVRDDFPTTASAMASALATVREAVREARIDLEVLPGAEIAFDRLHALPLEELRSLGLGGSSNLLVELPFFGWPLDAAEQLRRLREAGFTTVLAHPERNSAVQKSPARLVDLVRAGVLVQVTAGSLVGDFGPLVRRTARELMSSNLVHVLATDTHRASGPRTTLGASLKAIKDPGLRNWLVSDVPSAVIEGTLPPGRPSPARRWTHAARRRS
jgi:protein-tyrosine phosphatase